MLESARIGETDLLLEGAGVGASGTAHGMVRARIHGGAISHTAELPLFTALTPDLQITQNADQIAIVGELRGANGFPIVSVEGGHDLGIGGGEIQFVLGELLFGPGGKTGVAVSPVLASMRDLRGRLSGSAGFAWTGDGFENEGQLEIAGFSFRRDGMSVEGVNTRVSLDRLFPVRSLPSQHLSIARIDVGIEEVTALDMNFMVDSNADGVPRVFTEALGMNFAGGRVSATGGTIDPTTADADLTIMAENLDLAQILSRIGVEELTGEGMLNGTIPVSLRAGGASIEGAVLQADAPGIVAFRSDEARQALASGGGRRSPHARCTRRFPL